MVHFQRLLREISFLALALNHKRMPVSLNEMHPTMSDSTKWELQSSHSPYGPAPPERECPVSACTSRKRTSRYPPNHRFPPSNTHIPPHAVDSSSPGGFSSVPPPAHTHAPRARLSRPFRARAGSGDAMAVMKTAKCLLRQGKAA